MTLRSGVQPPEAPLSALPTLLTIKQAATVLGVSEKHVWGLIHEADVDRRSRWRFGREIVDLTPRESTRRTLRINLAAVAHTPNA